MEMKDCKMKSEGSFVSMPSEPQKDRYPSLSFGDTYSGLPLDFEDVEVGDKVVIHLIAKVTRKSEEEDEKGEKCSGSLDILEAGFKPYDTTEMRKKPIGKIKSEIDETLEND